MPSETSTGVDFGQLCPGLQHGMMRPSLPLIPSKAPLSELEIGENCMVDIQQTWFFLPIKWIKMDSNGPWHGILQEFLGISWWWAPMEPRKQHLESGLKKPRWIGGAHIISGETHWDSTLWWWYIHMIIYIYICIHKYIYDHIWV